MSLTGGAEGEYRSAQHEGSPVSRSGHPEGHVGVRSTKAVP